MNAAETRPLTLAVADWHALMICISDETDCAVVAGDPRGIMGLADSVRDTVGTRVGGERHLPDRAVTVALTLDQTALAFALLDRWADVAEQLGHHDSATEERRVRDRIGAAMANVPEWPQSRDGFLDPDTVHDYAAPEPDLTGMPPFHPGVPDGSRGRIPEATAHLYEPAGESAGAADLHAPIAEPDTSDTIKEPWAAALEELTRQRRREA
ncbi:hypothetical protein ACQEU3_43545 [Spirillospora sp. CA-253888]